MDLHFTPLAVTSAGAPWYSSGLTVSLVFVGAPLALTGLIWLMVVALDRRLGRPRSGDRPDPYGSEPTDVVPAGIAATGQPCWITTDERGRDVHEDAEPDSDDRAKPGDFPCWTVNCSQCGNPYLEDGDVVHFRGPGHAAATVRARGWEVTRARALCDACRP